LISFLLWIPAILGIGTLGYILYRIWVNKKNDATVVENAVLGMALISAVANWANLFFTISIFIQISVLLIGWGSFLYAICKKDFPKPSKSIFFAATVLLIGMSFLRANIAPSYHDSGLYGLQNVLWYNTTPLPLGLANLHGRFAYNSSWLAFASVIQFPTGDFFFSGELLLLFISFITLFSIEKSLKREWSPSIIYGLLISLVFLTPVLGTFTLSSIATDYPVFWLTIISAWINLRLLEHKIQSTHAIWFTTILFLWGITLKLSAFPLFFIVLSQLILEKKKVSRILKSLIKGISPFAFFFLAPWIIRFFLMSGCFFYPISFTCIEGIKWGTSISSVKWMSNHIQQMAIINTQNPIEIPLFWFTDKLLLKSWWNRYFNYAETWVLFFFIGLGIIIYALARKNKTQNHEILLLLPYAGGLAFWFFTAPALRFGSGYIWTIALLLLSFGSYHILRRKTSKTKKITLIFIQTLLFGLLVLSLTRRIAYLLPQDLSQHWIIPAPVPTIEFYSKEISGIEFHYPVKDDLLCWGEKLPCAPEPSSHLRIRTNEKGQISMFFIESE